MVLEITLSKYEFVSEFYLAMTDVDVSPTCGFLISYIEEAGT